MAASGCFFENQNDARLLALCHVGFPCINSTVTTSCVLGKEVGPLHLQGWEGPHQRPTESLPGLSFKLRCSWFTHHLLKVLWKDWGYAIDYAFTRPRTDQLILHTACVFLPWPEFRRDQVDLWLGRFLNGPSGEARWPSTASRADGGEGIGCA